MSKEAPVQNPAGNAVTGNFTLTATLPQGKSFNVSGYLYDGESLESVNQRVDLLHDVLDRQRTRAELPELEVKLEQSIQRLDDIKMHYAVILKKKDGGKGLATNEKQALEVMDVNVEKHTSDIEKGREAIAAAKAKLGIK